MSRHIPPIRDGDEVDVMDRRESEFQMIGHAVCQGVVKVRGDIFVVMSPLILQSEVKGGHKDIKLQGIFTHPSGVHGRGMRGEERVFVVLQEHVMCPNQ
jgi:hypothetical protein